MLAAYEAVCFQTRDLIEAFTKDVPSWKPIERLTVGGEFSENAFLLQLLADLCGIRIERPQTSFPSCLGAMIAAGLAIEILHLDQFSTIFTPPIEIFQPTMCTSSKLNFHIEYSILFRSNQIQKIFIFVFYFTQQKI